MGNRVIDHYFLYPLKFITTHEYTSDTVFRFRHRNDSVSSDNLFWYKPCKRTPRGRSWCYPSYFLSSEFIKRKIKFFNTNRVHLPDNSIDIEVSFYMIRANPKHAIGASLLG